jgi:hypothetical protein
MAAAVLAAAFLLSLLALPGRRIDLPPGSWQPMPTAVGSFHVHTNRSDGSGSPDEVAAAAAKAGLAFIILTDHGDGTRRPDDPQYRSGVLCIDAVEVSTSSGHYIAIGLPQTPYPLGGEASVVVEDVARFGGFGVVAHPDTSKPGLRWHEWTAPFDAMEWLNADSEWRDDGAGRLARALAAYPMRPVEALGLLLDRPDTTLQRWDTLTQRRRIVALAGADAHARAGWRDDDVIGYRRSWFVRMPSYEVSFRSFALRVTLDRPLTGNAAPDANRIIDALKAGQVYSGIDAIASPAVLEFSARAAGRAAGQGDLLHAEGPVAFLARVNAPGGGVIVLRKNGAILTQHPLPELRFESTAGNAVYRVEVYLADAPGQPPVPWIVSNPIYVQPAGWGTPVPATDSATTDAQGIQGGPWHVEKDTDSTAEVREHEPPTGPVEFTYRLAAGERRGQYGALVISVGHALEAGTRLGFRAQASRPMRVSVQARRPGSGERWQRSIYLDDQPREIRVPFSEMTPIGVTSTWRLDPTQIDTVLFVADTTNAAPGSEGGFTLSDVRVER